MAAIATDIRQRDLTRQATVEVRVSQTPTDRLSWLIGLAILRVAVWFMGFAGVEAHVPDQGGK